MSTPPTPAPRKSEELFEELDTTICRALVLSDELRRRFGHCPETRPEEPIGSTEESE
jgi:hypothetical protein